jgi:adenylate cyclase
MRMSPTDSFSGHYTALHGLALLAARRFAEALPFLRASVAALADYPGHYHSLISCCAHLGLHEEARAFLEIRNRLGPPVRLSVLLRRLHGFGHSDVFLQGLAQAGMME